MDYGDKKMVSFNPLGDKLVLCKTPSKLAGMGRMKPMYLRRYAKPSATAASLPVRIGLARAAIAARGQPVERVWSNVITSLSGKDFGGAAAATARRQMSFAQADASVTRMERELAAKRAM